MFVKFNEGERPKIQTQGGGGGDTACFPTLFSGHKDGTSGLFFLGLLTSLYYDFDEKQEIKLLKVVDAI